MKVFPKEFSPKVRELLWSRSRGYCEKCGRAMNPLNWCAHHRLLKSQGGVGSPQNGLACHHSCHNGDSDSIHSNPKLSYEMGWLVQSWNTPEKLPLRLPAGGSVRLTEEGTYD